MPNVVRLMKPSSLNQADRQLLRLIRADDADGWNQFLERYQHRLIAFAIGRVDQQATAEDLVQETFIAFLKSMNHFREQGSLESFLFRMLRRRIIDHYRASGQDRKVPACQIGTESATICLDQVASSDLTASQYARLDEQLDEDQHALSQAIGEVTGELCRIVPCRKAPRISKATDYCTDNVKQSTLPIDRRLSTRIK